MLNGREAPKGEKENSVLLWESWSLEKHCNCVKHLTEQLLHGANELATIFPAERHVSEAGVRGKL